MRTSLMSRDFADAQPRFAQIDEVLFLFLSNDDKWVVADLWKDRQH